MTRSGPNGSLNGPCWSPSRSVRSNDWSVRSELPHFAQQLGPAFRVEHPLRDHQVDGLLPESRQSPIDGRLGHYDKVCVLREHGLECAQDLRVWIGEQDGVWHRSVETADGSSLLKHRQIEQCALRQDGP